MRQIKFRGKNSKDEWVYGSLIINETENEKGKFQVAFIVPGLPCASDGDDFYTARMERVKIETIGQYTGLHDNKGNEIYEGDIFTVNGKYPKLVKYIDEWHSFCVANLDTITDPWTARWNDVCKYQQPAPNWWRDFQCEIKIIGNRYDNPELIKLRD